jgi:hypothetical protein
MHVTLENSKKQKNIRDVHLEQVLEMNVSVLSIWPWIMENVFLNDKNLYIFYIILRVR